MNQTIRAYYQLTKPGIIQGNLLTAVGGFFLASKGSIDIGTLLGLLAGMALVIGASCVFNSYMDRAIDALMQRTKSRATVSGILRTQSILIYGTMLALIGVLVLLLLTNWLTLMLGLIGFVSYVAVYTPAKHRTAYATLIGTVPGAIPPVAGYAAAGGKLDAGALLLFVILVCWQVPHFYAIAIRRKAEYEAAGVPVWPSVYGITSTKIQIVLFSIMFILSSVLLVAFKYVGYSFLMITGMGLWWTYLCLKGFRAADDIKWAKSVFLFSLLILPAFSIMMTTDHWLI